MTVTKKNICEELKAKIKQDVTILRLHVTSIRSDSLHRLRVNAQKILNPTIINEHDKQEFDSELKNALILSLDILRDSQNTNKSNDVNFIIEQLGEDIVKDLDLEDLLPAEGVEEDPGNSTAYQDSLNEALQAKNSNVLKRLNMAQKQAESHIDTTFSSLITEEEEKSIEAINSMESRLSEEFIGKILDLIQKYQELCSGLEESNGDNIDISDSNSVSASQYPSCQDDWDIPTILEIENMIDKAGMNIQGKVDFTTSPLEHYNISLNTQESLNYLSFKKRQSENILNDQIHNTKTEIITNP